MPPILTACMHITQPLPSSAASLSLSSSQTPEPHNPSRPPAAAHSPGSPLPRSSAQSTRQPRIFPSPRGSLSLLSPVLARLPRLHELDHERPFTPPSSAPLAPASLACTSSTTNGRLRRPCTSSTTNGRLRRPAVRRSLPPPSPARARPRTAVYAAQQCDY
jgi:hypothetical protein